MPNTRTITKLIFVFALTLMFIAQAQAQTKKLKRPSSRVGISSVDTFVRESFDIYDKVYMYDGYAEAGTPLSDDDITVLEYAIDDLTNLSESAPYVIGDLDGAGVLKQSKGTLQINRAKKALSYSIKTAKKLLANNKRSGDGDGDGDDETESDPSSDGNTDDAPQEGSSNDQNEAEESAEATNVSENLEVYSKFDFVPGDQLIFFDDFSQEFIGDFPSKWNTNGTGEVVRLSNQEGNWFELKGGYSLYYIPLIDQKLPEEYTIEFDFVVQGIDQKTSSQALANVMIDENNGFKDGIDYAYVALPLGQFGAFDIRARNRNKGPSQINSSVKADIRQQVLNKPHISIAVNKNRFRLWVNEKKYIDIPQFIYNPEKMGYLKFNVNGLKDGKERVFIQNIKVAKGGLDLRRTLMNEGKVSTNGILFDSGSANIQPQSYGIIRQISQVLLQDENINLNIIGHTDADGADDANLKLSKARADAVRDALITIYKISGDRLRTDGMGETQPVGDNTTSDGKAQNRRVEFVKI